MPEPTAPTPPPGELDRIKAFAARPDVPAEAKQAAVEAFARQYPPVGAGAPAPVPAAAPPAAPAPTPAQPEAPPAGELRTPGTLDTLRDMLPQRGPLGAIADVVTNPETAAAAAAQTAALALIPETGGATALLLPALAAGTSGGLAREGVARYQGRTPSWTERGVNFLIDALPVAVMSAVQKVVLSPAELDAATRALSGEKPPVPTAPTPEAMPPKPGAAPKAGKPVPVPEVAPGVQAGAVSAIPGAPIPPTVGPQMTKVAADALRLTEKDAAAKYAAEVSTASKLGLSEPTPQHILTAASDALDALDRSGLDPQVSGGARKLLESIRDVQGEVNPETGEIIVRKGKEPVEHVTYADLDAWRQKLQEYSSSFARLGQPQSFTKGTIGHVLGMVKDEMAAMAKGTEVEKLAGAADDFFINEVQPARKLARAVLKGETEPNAMVDALTKPANTNKLTRFLSLADRKAPAQAQAFRTVKYQNMVDRATAADGSFRPDAFLKELDAMPAQTRVAILGGTNRNEIRELLTNLEQARGLAKASQADAQATADATLARTQATHDQAVADYQAVAARNAQAKADFKATKGIEPPPSEDLVRARRKLSSQQMLLQAPPAVMAGTHAMQALLHGNAYPFMAWAAGESAAARSISSIMASPKAIPWINRVFKLAGVGASPNAIARAGFQVVYHLTESAGRLALRPGQSAPAGPSVGIPGAQPAPVEAGYP